MIIEKSLRGGEQKSKPTWLTTITMATAYLYLLQKLVFSFKRRILYLWEKKPPKFRKWLCPVTAHWTWWRDLRSIDKLEVERTPNHHTALNYYHFAAPVSLRAADADKRWRICFTHDRYSTHDDICFTSLRGETPLKCVSLLRLIQRLQCR